MFTVSEISMAIATFSDTTERMYEALKGFVSPGSYRAIVRQARGFSPPDFTLSADHLPRLAEATILAASKLYMFERARTPFVDGLSMFPPKSPYAMGEYDRLDLVQKINRMMKYDPWSTYFNKANLEDGYYSLSYVRGGVKFDGNDFSSVTHLAGHLLADPLFLKSEHIEGKTRREKVHHADVTCDFIFAAVWFDHLFREQYLENL
jgi:hypothetical protein